MTEKNKVVIKINYNDLNNLKKPNLQPKIVTEWNYKRIFFALAFIAGLLLLGILFLTSVFDIKEFEKVSKISPQLNNKPVHKKIDTNIRNKFAPELNKLKPLITTEIELESSALTDTVVIDSPVNTKIVKSQANINTPSNPINKVEKITTTIEKEKNILIISDTRVSKALITRGIKNKEPIDKITLPISLNVDDVIEIHYFTEIMDMKGQILSHHWLWGEQSIYTKKIKINGNRWRASTSKLIQYSKSGEWTVRLINESDIILNEIKFEIQKIKINN